jgi:hypothetical protein
MSIRNEPNVVDYNRSSYDSYGRPIGGTSSVGPQQTYPANQDPRYPTQPEYQSQTGQPRFPDRRTGTNYDDYRKSKYEYKYNIYSLIDEPWNRCCEVGKCGNCPGN